MTNTFFSSRRTIGIYELAQNFCATNTLSLKIENILKDPEFLLSDASSICSFVMVKIHAQWNSEPKSFDVSY